MRSPLRLRVRPVSLRGDAGRPPPGVDAGRRAWLAIATGVAACALVALASCSSDGGGGSASPGDDASTPGCPEGQAFDADGACAAVLPTDPCGPGTRAVLGSTTCSPVGWTSCPSGFAVDDSGWGCRPVLPASACDGATRDALGETTCHPIGDCNAAFPPAGATYFVDAAYTAGQLDGAHFATIHDAVNAAPDGATIAVEGGTYAEAITIGKQVSIVGRCAEKVVLNGAGISGAGLFVDHAALVRGVTLTGFVNAVDVEFGGDLTLDGVILSDNHTTAVAAYDSGHATLTGSVVRRTSEPASGGQTTAVLVAGAGKIDLVDSAVTENVDAGLGAIDKGSRITMKNSVVRDTQARQNRSGGIGAKVFNSGSLSFDGSALWHDRGMELLVSGPKAHADVTHVAFGATALDDRSEGGVVWGISVLQGATLTMTESSLVDMPVVGLSVKGAGSRADVARSTFTHMEGTGFLGVGTAIDARDGATVAITGTAVNEAIGIAINANIAGTLITLDDSLVNQTQPTAPGKGPTSGGGGTGLSSVRGAKLVATHSTIQGSREVAAAAYFDGAEIVLDRTLVDDTRPNANDVFGHGTVADQGAKMTITASVVRRSTGVGVVYAGSGGLVTGSIIEDNAVGIHAQDGSTLVELDTAQGTSDPLSVEVTGDTRFTGNATKVGSGDIPLPGEPLGPPSN